MLRSSVCPSVCLFRFDFSSSLDGDIRALPFQTRSKGVSTVGYVRIQMLSSGAYRFAALYLDKLKFHGSSFLARMSACRRVGRLPRSACYALT